MSYKFKTCNPSVIINTNLSNQLETEAVPLVVSVFGWIPGACASVSSTRSIFAPSFCNFKSSLS